MDDPRYRMGRMTILSAFEFIGSTFETFWAESITIDEGPVKLGFYSRRYGVPVINRTYFRRGCATVLAANHHGTSTQHANSEQCQPGFCLRTGKIPKYSSPGTRCRNHPSVRRHSNASRQFQHTL